MYKLALFSLLFLVLSSCDKNQPTPKSTVNFSKGVIIINEGNFMHSNGDFTYYNPTSDTTVNNIFALNNNNLPAGDVIQSFAAQDSIGIFTANNSKTLTFVNLKTFELLHQITGLSYPRYIKTDANTAFLTNGKAPGQLLKINIETMQISDSVELGAQPENLIISKDYLICCNGAWGNDSTISIINKSDFSLSQHLVVGQGTTDITVDNNGNYWVLCQGRVEYDDNWNIVNQTPSELVVLDKTDFSEIYRTETGTTADDFYPTRLSGSATADFICYAEHDGIYKINTYPPYEPEKIINGSYYGLEIEPSTGNIYTFSANGFQTTGNFSIFDSAGTRLKHETEAGIGPNGAVFPE
ncbi:MAG: hypothetical protein U9N85_10450 [Bacteroidota bacterium]|nr:hypothetical protein [Bacteroidota bacterium]